MRREVFWAWASILGPRFCPATHDNQHQYAGEPVPSRAAADWDAAWAAAEHWVVADAQMLEVLQPGPKLRLAALLFTLGCVSGFVAISYVAAPDVSRGVS